jgi:hypothetical protein
MEAWLNKHYYAKKVAKDAMFDRCKDEKIAFKLMQKELEKAFKDFATDEDYCEHLDRLKIMIDDFKEQKHSLNIGVSIVRPV